MSTMEHSQVDAAVESLDISNPLLFRHDRWQPVFARLRREDPVHHVEDSPYGSFWALTRHADIVATEKNNAVFSSAVENGGILLMEPPPGMERTSFLRMDPPDHTRYRKMASPVANPMNLEAMEALIRARTARVFDGLPVNGDAFDWVKRVSIELTSMMAATLFDYPEEERHYLVHISDVVFANINDPDAPVHSEEERFAELLQFTDHMSVWWERRANEPKSFDLLSVLAHDADSKNMTLAQRVGILTTFVGGGNDTTKNTMSGGALALFEHPDEFQKLREDRSLIANAASEIVRWQTPVVYMRRNPMEDTEIGGKTIRKGEKVIMWYVSANRDDEVIERPDEFLVDRSDARKHLAFGSGIHRCLGNRLAELQVRVLLEELLDRDLRIEVVGEPERGLSNFVRSFTALPTRLVT